MFRLIISFGLIIGLYTYCPTVNAANNADAFAMDTSNIVAQPNPTISNFLKKIATSLKNDWQTQTDSHSPKVFVTFNNDTSPSWHIYPVRDKPNEYQADAIKLLEQTLQVNTPPKSEPFGLWLIFDNQSGNCTADINAAKKIDKADIDFGPYMASLQTKIKCNWVINKKPTKNTTAVANFVIKTNGSLEGLHLVKSSNFTEYNQSTLKAIKNSAPFPPLPFSYPDIQISYQFYYQTEKTHDKENLFKIYLSQPEVVTAELVNLKSIITRLTQPTK